MKIDSAEVKPGNEAPVDRAVPRRIGLDDPPRRWPPARQAVDRVTVVGCRDVERKGKPASLVSRKIHVALGQDESRKQLHLLEVLTPLTVPGLHGLIAANMQVQDAAHERPPGPNLHIAAEELARGEGARFDVDRDAASDARQELHPHNFDLPDPNLEASFHQLVLQARFSVAGNLDPCGRRLVKLLVCFQTDHHSMERARECEWTHVSARPVVVRHGCAPIEPDVEPGP